MFNLNPKEDKFYTMISESAKNVNEAAIILRKNLDNLSKKDTDVNKTEALEEKGDELVRKITKELNEAFITPIDREDIYEIIKFMDKILDLISATMHRFIMYDIEESTEGAKLIGDKLVEITKELLSLMEELKLKDSKSNGINEKIANITKIEEEADLFFRNTVAKLFREETDPLTVIKWKEIYQIMENTIDNCERVAIVVEGVVIKNA